jgi:hypothetical protein
MAAIHEKLLEERLTSLESARSWTPRLVSKLESHIRSASDPEPCPRASAELTITASVLRFAMPSFL